MALSVHARYIALETILVKEVLRFMRIWVQTILPPAITTALYFIIFGNLIGSQLQKIHGYDYNQYIAPGLIMMAVLTNAYSNVVASFFSAKYQRHVEEMMVSPLPNHLILIGFTLGGVARGLVVGVVVTVVALFFTDLHLSSFWITASIVLLTSALFSLGGFLNALYAKDFDDISIVPTFVLTPLTYLGGVFYSVDALSPFWHGLSLANPILYMVNAFREGVLGISDIGLGWAFLVTISFTVALYWICLDRLNRGIGLRH